MLLWLVLNLDLYIYDVCRKLAELGFKKSAEECKEKFEDESRYFNNINYGKSDQFLSELEELCQADQNPYRVVTEKNNPQHDKPSEEGDKIMGHVLEAEDSRNIDPPLTKPCDRSDKMMVEKSKDRKRKRSVKFEMFKGFCESIVTKMMAQQEEIHNKLLEDMLKRDEAKLAKEEAWKKQEMNRMNKELEMMAQEQAIAWDRHFTIIDFLKKYAPSSLASQNLNDSKRNSPCTFSSPLNS